MPPLSTQKMSSLLLLILFLPLLSVQQCPSGTTGYNCVSCPSGCDTCDTDPTYCDTCTTGYYLDSSNLCNACPNNCLACSTPYVCTTCTPGYDAITNADGYEECEFKWWKWFLIIFGILFGVFIVGLLIWCIRMKLKEEDMKDKEVDYEMKLEHTEPNLE